MNNNVNNTSGDVKQQKPKVAITEPAPLVQQAAQQSFAANNFFANGNRAMGRFENPNVVKPPLQNAGEEVPADNVNKNPGPVTENPPVNNNGMPSWNEMAPPTNGWNPDGSAQYGSLSDALNNSSAKQSPQADFHAEPEKKDGGFFKWIKGLVPKLRPGRREGETDDEYDRRRTRNMEMVATFADAIRHMGNIVNTSKGAPAQQFNDPVTAMEQGYQKRKAERAAADAAAAENAYKMANLSLKEKAAQANQAYKDLLLKLNLDKFGYQKDKDKKASDYKEKKDKRDFKYRQDRDKIKDEQTDRRLNVLEYNATHKGSGRGKSSGGSSHKYVTYDADGNPHYAENKTMFEVNEARYNGNTGGKTSRSTSRENVTAKGIEKVTSRTSGPSVAQQAGAQLRKRDEAKKAAQAKKKGNGRSKGGNHSALNNWFAKNNK